MRRYEILDHTADIGLTGYGRTLDELFLHMAQGMFGVRADVTAVQPMASIPILVHAEDREGLLLAWLKELLFAAERDRMVFMNCRIVQLLPTALSGEAVGEAYDPSRHTLFREIKAVTHHGVEVRRDGELWTAQVIFDI